MPPQPEAESGPPVDVGIDLETRAALLTMQRELAAEERSPVNDRMGVLTTSVLAVQDRMMEDRAVLYHRLGGIDIALSGIGHDSTVVKSCVRVLANDVGLLKTDMREVKADVGVLKEDVRGLKADVGVLKEDVRGLKADVGVLKEDVSVLKADVGELKQRVGNLEVRFDNLEVRFDNLEVRFDNLEVRFDKLEVRFDKLERKVDNLDLQFGLMRDDMRKLLARTEELVGYIVRDETKGAPA